MTQRGTADTVTTTLTGTDKWVGGVAAGNGLIYGIPRDAGAVLVIDPDSHGVFCDSVLLSGYLNKL